MRLPFGPVLDLEHSKFRIALWASKIADHLIALCVGALIACGLIHKLSSDEERKGEKP